MKMKVKMIESESPAIYKIAIKQLLNGAGGTLDI